MKTDFENNLIEMLTRIAVALENLGDTYEYTGGYTRIKPLNEIANQL